MITKNDHTARSSKIKFNQYSLWHVFRQIEVKESAFKGQKFPVSIPEIWEIWKESREMQMLLKQLLTCQKFPIASNPHKECLQTKEPSKRTGLKGSFQIERFQGELSMWKKKKKRFYLFPRMSKPNKRNIFKSPNILLTLAKFLRSRCRTPREKFTVPMRGSREERSITSIAFGSG